jgi:hypothetical protein
MLIVVLRGNNLDNRLGLVFESNLHSNHLQMTKCYLHSKEGQQTFSIQLTNIKTIIFWEALECEAALSQLHTFHIDLHPPTHVRLKFPMANV